MNPAKIFIGFCITAVLVLSMLGVSSNLFAQNEKPQLYNEQADALKELDAAVQKAKEEQKHVLVQVGGNWCPWCIKLHAFLEADTEIDSLIKANYVFVLVNFSKAVRNPEAMARLEYPQRFGFPALVVLDEEGKRIHTQDSGFLESGQGYDRKKVITFLKAWTVEALKAENYK